MSEERKNAADEIVVLARGIEERAGYLVAAAETGTRITIEAYRRDFNANLDAIASIQDRMRDALSRQMYGENADRRPLAAKTAPGAHSAYR
jgi:hypothetical protein